MGLAVAHDRGGAALARAARALVGTRFRLRGRDPATGIDCIGVLDCALRAAGCNAAVPADYQLRMRNLSRLDDWAAAHGFRAMAGAFRPGDVAAFAVGPAQAHLAIAVDGAADGPIDGAYFVHAHAGLGRVVCAPVPGDWPEIGHWRWEGRPWQP